jgi:hypothetical protein
MIVLSLLMILSLTSLKVSYFKFKKAKKKLMIPPHNYQDSLRRKSLNSGLDFLDASRRKENRIRVIKLSAKATRMFKSSLK